MRKWTGTVILDRLEVTSEELATELGKPEEEVTKADAESFFADQLDNLAGSNDGSEALANADIDIKKTINN